MFQIDPWRPVRAVGFSLRRGGILAGRFRYRASAVLSGRESDAGVAAF